MENNEEILEGNAECQICGEMTGTHELHSCPYAEDIRGNYTANCNCCGKCTDECAMNISNYNPY